MSLKLHLQFRLLTGYNPPDWGKDEVNITKMLRTVLSKHQLLLVHQEPIPVYDMQGMLASGLVTSGWARVVLQEPGSAPQSMRLGVEGKQHSGNGNPRRREA